MSSSFKSLLGRQPFSKDGPAALFKVCCKPSLFPALFSFTALSASNAYHCTDLFSFSLPPRRADLHEGRHFFCSVCRVPPMSQTTPSTPLGSCLKPICGLSKALGWAGNTRRQDSCGPGALEPRHPGRGVARELALLGSPTGELRRSTRCTGRGRRDGFSSPSAGVPGVPPIGSPDAAAGSSEVNEV